MLDNSQICVSYQDDYGVWKYVEQELKAHLPLRNVTWKTKTGSTKIIDKINIDVVPYDDERLQFPSVSANNYRKPFLSLLLVQCEDQDAYKQLVKGKIRARFSELTSKLHRSVYDKIRADFNVKRDRCCQLRMSDDVKTEEFWDDTLNKIKEGIVASIDQYITSYEEEIKKTDSKRRQPGWNFYGFFFLKESLAFTYERAQMFEEALIQYDELEALYLETGSAGRFGGTDPGDDAATLILDPQKNIREFDFRQYLFARQMKLLFALNRPAVVAERAMSFINGVSLALARNKRALQEKGQSQPTPAPAPNSPSPSPSPSPHPYQQPAWVFSAATAIAEACESATAANPVASPPIPSAPSTPSAPTKALPRTPSQAPSLQRFLSVRSQSSQSNISINTPSTPQPTRTTSDPGPTTTRGSEPDNYLECLLADLIYLARAKLDILGRHFKLLPQTSISNPPLATLQLKNSSDTDTPKDAESSAPNNSVKFTNSILQEALQSEAAFDKLYIDITGIDENVDMTQKALDLYSSANRQRSVVKLNFEMAFLYYHRSQYEKAELLLKAVSSTYGSDGWYALEYNARSILTECERRLAHVREYISDCIALLAPNLPLSPDERLSYVDHIVSHAPKLSPPLSRDLFPVFNLSLNFVENKYTLGATVSYLDLFAFIFSLDISHIQVKCTINSTLPKPVLINKATLYLAPQVTAPLTPTSTPLLPRDNSSSSLSKTKESPRMGSAYNISPMTTSTSSSSLSLASTAGGPTEDGVSISVQDLNIVPGQNILLFETEAKLKGQFVSTSLTLELGQLSFYHQLLQYERSTITITESTSKVGLLAKSPISLFLRIPQRVLITISTGPEPLVAATLSVRSATGAQFLEIPDEVLVLVRQATNENTPGDIVRYHTGTLHTSANGTGKLSLSALNANEFIEVYVPVVANNEQPCVHQMRVELIHEKRTREMFFLATSASLPFAHAFSATAVCAPVHLPTPRTLVQAILTSTAGDTLTISDYSISGPATIVHDPNAQHIKRTAVRPNQQTSLVFCITTTDNKASQDISLDVKFTCPSPVPLIPAIEGLPEVDVKKFSDSITHSFSTILTLALPTPQYRIETRNPPTAYLAQPILFELSITQVQPTPKNENSDNEPLAVLFEIEEDPLWVISGKRKASLQLAAGTPTSVSCRLRPISAGIIPIPKVKLCGVPVSSFIVAPKGPPHVQVFPEPITSECTATVDEVGVIM